MDGWLMTMMMMMMIPVTNHSSLSPIHSSSSTKDLGYYIFPPTTKHNTSQFPFPFHPDFFSRQFWMPHFIPSLQSPGLASS